MKQKYISTLLICAYHIAGLDNGVHDFGCDAAVIVPVACDLHVACLAPTLAPAVLRQPVVTVFGVRAVAHDQYFVVQILLVALRLVKDTCRDDFCGQLVSRGWVEQK